MRIYNVIYSKTHNFFVSKLTSLALARSGPIRIDQLRGWVGRGSGDGRGKKLELAVKIYICHSLSIDGLSHHCHVPIFYNLQLFRSTRNKYTMDFSKVSNRSTLYCTIK